MVDIKDADSAIDSDDDYGEAAATAKEAARNQLHELKVTIEQALSEINCNVAVSAQNEICLQLAAADIVSTAAVLRDNTQLRFVSLIDICGVDYPEREQRFEVVYHLLSPVHNQRLRLKVAAGEQQPVPSLSEIYPAANWYEREAYDMYGILFDNHPDMRRILTDYGFDGYPLRKDFPLTGFSEVRYDDELKRVIYEPVMLDQEFRDFDFASPWHGYDHHHHKKLNEGDDSKDK